MLDILFLLWVSYGEDSNPGLHRIPLKRRFVSDDEQQTLIELINNYQTQLHQTGKLRGTQLVQLQSEASLTVALKNFANTQFVGSVGVGNPPQFLDVIFDTGSANFWVNSKLCDDDSCLEHSAYDHQKSSDYETLGYYLEVQFGTGGINGEINQDSVTLGGMQIINQPVGEITDEIGQVFADAKFSGILGLGFPSMAAYDLSPVFDSMMNQKLLEKNIVSFYYSLNPLEQSEILFGEVDTSKFTGPITYVNVIQGLEYYWLIKVDDIRIGKESLGVCGQEGCRAAVDTGTTLLTAPSSDLIKLLNAMGDDCKNYREFPDLIFVIDGKEFKLNPSAYVITLTSYAEDSPGMHSDNVVDCTVAIMPLDVGPP